MAARSPVTIESSSPYEAYQAPSITPEGLRQSANNIPTIPSSPQLLSPSSSVRPRIQPLKSGSRIQQVPAGAQAGFATAASIWKQSKDKNIVVEDEGSHRDSAPVGERRQSISKGREPTTKSTCKLARPKKTTKSGNPALITNTALENSPLNSVQPKGTLTSTFLHTAKVEETASHDDVAQSRRSSINLSEYSFNADTLPAPLPSPNKGVPQITSVGRKRSSKKTIPGDAPTLKKPRKSKAKSEAIILDSDEPEEVLDGANPHVTTELPVTSEAVAKKPRPPKTNASTLSETNSEDAAAEPVTTAKKRKVVKPSVKSSTERSVYFERLGDRLPSSPPPVLHPKLHPAGAHFDTGETNAVHPFAGTAPSPAEIAPRRRRCWTPAKDSLNERTTNTSPAISGGLSESREQVPFSALLGNFSYLNPEIDLTERTTGGEAIRKRRRIELSERCAAPQPPIVGPSKAESVSKAGKPVKKPKAVPKKPQTVTALALAAYQPPREADSVQSTVSTHFPPQKEVENVPVAKGDADSQGPVAKSKKPRKSRAKAPSTEGDVATTKNTAKAKSKATKAKVKFDKTEHVAPLYSPTQACKQMRAQDFIFGTSSQLAADESPDFVRDMQLAIHQSELTCPIPNSSQIGTQPDSLPLHEGKSCTSVPSAPHGTCLSVEQARRELWCASARDSTGSKLAPELPMLLPEAPPAADKHHFKRVVDVVTLSSSGQEALLDQAKGQQKMLGSEPKSETSTTREVPRVREDADHTVLAASDQGVPRLPAADGSAYALIKDDWTILRSDDSASLPQPTTVKPIDRSYDLATSSARRTALQPLDANISIIGSDSAWKLTVKPQAHSFSTLATPLDRDAPRVRPTVTEGNTDSAATPTRGRGRPRKNSSLERPAQTSPARGRGRPRKHSLVDKTAATSPARARGRPRKDTSIDRTGVLSPKRPVGRPRKEGPTARLTSMSPKRPVGRPRKNDTASRVLSIPPEKPVVWPRQTTTAGAASPPSFRKVIPKRSSASQPTPWNEWINIDEISDTDAPNTPSPRRRRASSSPSQILPLDFDAPLSPLAMPKSTIAGNAAMKATDAVWPNVQASIFPQIAETIKAAPLGTDINTPSWHEKILLYDPIVLEDLTAWLNEQGLRTEVERLKVKTKTRGRKKKDAPPEVDEWETIRDELKPWMVQKWCEDNSICCLWKEGLRGGVKARY